MKIQIISDLHQEFGMMDLSFGNADVVIIAGDVNLGTKGIQWIKSKIPNQPVIYVLGNHEYYKGSYPKTLNKIKAEAENTMFTFWKMILLILKMCVFMAVLCGRIFPFLGTRLSLVCTVSPR